MNENSKQNKSLNYKKIAGRVLAQLKESDEADIFFDVRVCTKKCFLEDSKKYGTSSKGFEDDAPYYYIEGEHPNVFAKAFYGVDDLAAILEKLDFVLTNFDGASVAELTEH